MVADGGYFGLTLAQDRPPHWAKGCAVCIRLPRAGRVRSRLNGSEGLAVASRRSGEGLEADGWRLTADGSKAGDGEGLSTDRAGCIAQLPCVPSAPDPCRIKSSHRLGA